MAKVGRWLGGLRASKYGNRRVQVDGRSFASRAQSARYLELRTMQKAGLISDLTLDPRINLTLNGIALTVYQPDFRYYDRAAKRWKVEDVKGYMNAKDPVVRLFKLKASLHEALTGEKTDVIKKTATRARLARAKLPR